MIALIDENAPVFPEYSPNTARDDGLIAVSRTLTPALILAAYQHGIFPWYQDETFFYWFALHPRAVLLPEKLHLSHSLRQTLRHKNYRISINQAFEDVIAACATTPRPMQNGTWISPDFQAAYTTLHHLGHAHSFECWLPKNDGIHLAGGLYGVQIGSVFYGESMFSRCQNAAKIAFAYAVPHLAHCGIQLIDCQQDSNYLRSFGAQTLPFTTFRHLLNELNSRTLHHPLNTLILADTFQAA